MTPELDPCPFCFSTGISSGEVLGERPDGTKYSQTGCLSCGALGPERPTEADADDAWNLRAKLREVKP